MRKMILAGAFGLLAATGLAMSVQAAPVTTYDGALGGSGFYNGTGNVDTHFTITTNGEIQLGLRAAERFVGPFTPTGNVYNVPKGLGVGGLPKWNFEFSALTNLLGAGTLRLSDVDLVLTVKDVANSTVMSLDLLLIPDNAGFGTGGEHNPALVTDWGVQNSENPGFAGIKAALMPLYDEDQDNTFLLRMALVCGAGTTQCQVGTTIDWVDISVVQGKGALVSTPASLALFVPALLGLAAIRRRKSAA